MWTPYEQRAIRDEIKTLLSLLWRTGEIFLHKPDVAAERRNIMHYLYAVFPDVLPVLDRPTAPGVGAPRFRPGAAAPAPDSLPAVPPEHLGGRRPGRTSARHRRRDSSDAGRPAPARIAAAAASAGRRWRGRRACRIACSRRRRRCAIASVICRRRRWRRQAIARRAGGNLAAAGRPDAGASAAGERLSRRAGGCGTTPDDIGAPANCSPISACCTTSLVAVGAWRVADEAVGPVIRTRADVRLSPRVARRPPEQRASTIWRSRSCRRRQDSSGPISRTGTRRARLDVPRIASSRRRGRSCAPMRRRALKRTRCWARYRVLVEQLRDLRSRTGWAR